MTGGTAQTVPEQGCRSPETSAAPPAWIEIDLDAIASNISAVRRWVAPRAEVMAVVKANAYGHGMVPAARAALRGGATVLGVARQDEGLQLRASGIRAPVVVLSCGLPDGAGHLVEAGLSQMVSGVQAVRALARAARALGEPARVHIKIDTGMGRVGVRPEEVNPLAEEIASLPELILEGIATHIAWDEPDDRPRARRQIARFCECLRSLTQPAPRWRHAANSAMTVHMPEAHFDLVRVGLLTYGIPPTGGASRLGLRPALAIKARITQVKSMRPGETVSYGGRFTVQRPSKLAIVPVGYADGYARRLTNRAEVLLRGCRCPAVGAICMDQTVVDITSVPDAAIGDEVVLLGRGDGDEITVCDLAHWMDGISHEVVSQLGERLPRIWKSETMDCC